MAGLDEFYPQGATDGFQRRGYGGRRPVTVPQFEAESGFFGGNSNSNPRLVNLEPDRKRDLKDVPDGPGNADHYAGLGIGVAGLVAESLVAHPLVVLRRTCQVSSSTLRHHRTPLTLMPVVIRLYRSQGVPSLWKGFGSSLIIRGLLLTAEDFVGKFTPWPKEIEFPSSPKMIGQHLLLKAVSLAVVTPFFSVSLIESVQSDIASQSPGILDIFKEGFARIFTGGGPRALPMWYLIPATVSFGLVHYVVSSSVKLIFVKLMRFAHRQKQNLRVGTFVEDDVQELSGAVSKREEDIPGFSQYRDRISLIVGQLFADVLLFPAETILHRLHLQGSRTIIDNLDTGREVLPVTTGYLGVYDCANEILVGEGLAGFYRGFGALIVQYALQLAIVRFSTFSIREIMKLLKEDAPPELIRPTSSVKVVTPPTSSASLDAASLSASPVRNPSTFASTQATHANVASPRYPDSFSGSAPFGSRYPSADPFSHPSSAATTPSSAARFNDHFSPQRFNDPFIAQQQQIFQEGMSSSGRRKIHPTDTEF